MLEYLSVSDSIFYLAKPVNGHINHQRNGFYKFELQISNLPIDLSISSNKNNRFENKVLLSPRNHMAGKLKLKKQ